MFLCRFIGHWGCLNQVKPWSGLLSKRLVTFRDLSLEWKGEYLAIVISGSVRFRVVLKISITAMFEIALVCSSCSGKHATRKQVRAQSSCFLPGLLSSLRDNSSLTQWPKYWPCAPYTGPSHCSSLAGVNAILAILTRRLLEISVEMLRYQQLIVYHSMTNF
jgi:hypothetical protein